MSTRFHLTEADISAASDGERLESLHAQHLERCSECRARVAAAIALRASIAHAATVEIAPEHDLAKRAVAAIARRDEAVASLNGTVGTFAGVARAVLTFALGRRT